MSRADRWIEEITAGQPSILEACEAAMRQGEQDSDFFRVQREAFLASPANSIDYAVMEPITQASADADSGRDAAHGDFLRAPRLETSADLSAPTAGAGFAARGSNFSRSSSPASEAGA